MEGNVIDKFDFEIKQRILFISNLCRNFNVQLEDYSDEESEAGTCKQFMFQDIFSFGLSSIPVTIWNHSNYDRHIDMLINCILLDE